MDLQKRLCPEQDFDCPYAMWEDDVVGGYICTLENPMEDCDDYAYYYYEEEE